MMSGLLRDLLTLIQAMASRTRCEASARVDCHFFITPLDCGTSVLKSDRYLQLAESAQLDFLVKTGLLGKLLRQGVRFVNASQMVKFSRPVGVFSSVLVQTSIVYADSKCAWFSHTVFSRNQQCAEILVKMKFKKGAMTVAPAELAKVAGGLPSVKPAHLVAWDECLAGMA